MSWMNEIDQIRNDVSNHRMLLSSALLLTAQAVRNVVQPGIVFWLNREVVGYDKEDCDFVLNSGDQWVFLARNVVAPWGRTRPNGVFIAKGSASAVLTDGIQQIETALSNMFDISIFEQGQRELIDRTIKSSNCDMERCFVPYMGVEGAALAVSGKDLVNIYFGVCANLCNLINSVKQSMSGKYLLVP